MQQPTLKASLRQTRSKAKQLRSEELVPAVIYSRGTDTQSITVSSREFDKMIRTYGQNTLFNVDVEGEISPALVREVQRDTLKDMILHVDFLRVSLDEEIQFELFIVIKGDAEGIKQGGVLQQQKRTLAAKSLARDMPESAEIDISGLLIGDTITVGDVEVDEKVELLDDPEEVIVTMLAPRMEEEEEEEVEEDEEGIEDAEATEEDAEETEE